MKITQPLFIEKSAGSRKNYAAAALERHENRSEKGRVKGEKLTRIEGSEIRVPVILRNTNIFNFLAI